MPIYESPAIILRNIKLGDNDKIVTFFTSQFGKVKAVAKGAYGRKSRFGGKLEPFIHCNMTAFGKENSDLLRLNACDIIESFAPLRDDFERINRAFVSAELVDVCQRERDLNVEGYKLLLDYLRALSSDGAKARQDLLLRAFELKYMGLIGYQPSLERCVHCAGEIGQGKAGFNIGKGGAVCGDCLRKDHSALKVSVGAVKLMSKSVAAPFDRLMRLTANAEMMKDIEKVVNEFIRAHTRREMRSERFLKL